MAIPKTIFQTFKTTKLPLLTRWHINRFRKNNPEYDYQFYDDKRIEEFFRKEFDANTFDAYRRLNIGAAKADMFRYAILYKKGGVYLDIDSEIKGKLSEFVNPNDAAIISYEKNPHLFVQWALFFESGHPFLKRTLDLIVDNIRTNRYPHDVHSMTGPTVFTKAVNDCIKEDPAIVYRILGTDYEGKMRFKYRFSKLLLYEKGGHWKKQQLKVPVVKSL